MLTCHGIRCIKAIILLKLSCIAANYFKEYTLIYCSHKNFEDCTFKYINKTYIYLNECIDNCSENIRTEIIFFLFFFFLSLSNDCTYA